MKRAGRLTNAVVGGCVALAMLGTTGLVIASVANASTPMTATTWVNMRSGPSTSYGVVSVLAPNEAVTSNDVSGGWHQVTTAKGVTGWVYQNYLKASEQAPAPSSPAPAQPTDPAPAASGQATTTAAVNVRSGPSTGYSIVGVAAKGSTLPTTGKTSGGWTEVVWSGAARWISSNYLTTGTPTESKPAGQVRTTANLYLRTGGSTAYSYTGVLPANSVVDTTGQTTSEYTEIIHSGQNRWIATRYTTAVTSTAPTPAPAPVATGSVIVNVGALYVRATSASNGTIVGTVYRGNELKTTGVEENSRIQVIHNGVARWVYKPYTTPAGSTAPAPSDPVASGQAWVNVGSLYVRATSAANGTVVGTVYRSNELATTGVVEDDRLQIVHNGVARWVYKPYTTTTDPGSAPAPSPAPSTSVSLPGYDRLQPNAKIAVQHVLDTYPLIRTIGGYRASSSYSSDHPNGRAIDVMVSNWSTQASADYGWTIARDFAANASKYEVTYIIWRQQIWNASYPERGWRWMEDRGSATANHYDHVHISFKDQ